MKGLKGIIVLFTLAVCQVASSKDPSHDLTQFSFAKNFETAYQLAKSKSLPIMLITHKSGCPACDALMPKLNASSELKRLSINFIMVNNCDRQDLLADNIRPDNNRNYHPRIIFFDRNGEILTEIFNSNQPNFKLYYTTPDEVAVAMKKAIEANKKS